MWLDCVAYARRLFSPGEDVWAETGPYVELIRQAQRLLGSDVIEVRLGDFHRAALVRDPTVADSLRGGRLLRAVRRLLEQEEPTRTACEVVSALHGLYPDHPVVLVVDSGEHWLRWAAEATGAEWDGDPDDVDSVAVYLADAVRSFASTGVSAVVLDVLGDESAPADELVKLHRPLLNLAEHYSWSVAVRAGEAQIASVAGLDEVDVLLCPDSSFLMLTKFVGASYCGGGLNPSFWSVDDAPEIPDRVLGYGEIPDDAYPERVLSRLSALRTRS